MAGTAGVRGPPAELDGVAVVVPVWPDGAQGPDHPGADWRGRGRAEPHSGERLRAQVQVAGRPYRSGRSAAASTCPEN